MPRITPPNLGRRHFHRSASAFALSLLPLERAAAALNPRAVTGEQLWLELDGALARARAAEGGHPRAELTTLPPPRPGMAPQKQVVGLRTPELAVDLLPDVPKLVLEWINSAAAGQDMPRSGQLITTDHNAIERQRLAFKNAVVTGFEFDALDAREPLVSLLTLRLQAESATATPGSGRPVSAPPSSKASGIGGFRLRIKGLEEACSRIVRIEPFGARRSAAAGGRLDTTPLVLLLPNDASAAAFYEWHADFVLRGNHDASRERPGVIELMSRSGTEVVMTLSFGGIGIVACTPDATPDPATGGRRARVELYFETLTLGTGNVGGGAPLLPRK